VPLPENRWVFISRAAEIVSETCGVSVEDARDRLDQAFRDDLRPRGRFSSLDPWRWPDDWTGAEVDWASNSVTWRSRFNTLTYHDMQVFSERLNDWIGLPVVLARSGDPAPTASVAPTDMSGTHKRKRNAAEDAKRRNEVEAVFAAARTKFTDDQIVKWTEDKMSKMLIAERKKIGPFGQSAIERILKGNYQPARNLGIEGGIKARVRVPKKN
jgi:hypothetical protein